MLSPSTLLVVDDDGPSRRLVTAIFGAEGLRVVAAADGRAGLEMVTAEAPDVVLLDMEMPEMDGLEVLEALAQRAPGLPVVMLTANRDVKNAVRATRLGAYDYLTKPIDRDEVVAVVGRALEAGALREEVARLKRTLDDGLEARMGTSAEVRGLVGQVHTVASTDFTVLLLGETGTGKELVAQAIHLQSARSGGTFIAVDCGAIPEALLESELFGHERGAFTGADRKRRGHFELARGGTLFLDEIGNLPLGLQAKLLRALESKEVRSVGGDHASAMDVRFVAATNDDLESRVEAGQFRADLYYRLAQYTIRLPALRERRSDIPRLAARFLAEATIELRRPVSEIGRDALDVLERHDWPGNVRELRNVVRQCVMHAHGSSISKEVVRTVMGRKKPGPAPSPRLATGSLKEIADAAAHAAEKAAITEVLAATRGNQAKTARLLQTDTKTLYVKMKRLGLRARDFNP